MELDQAFINRTERRIETITKRMDMLNGVIHAPGMPGTAITGRDGVSAARFRALGHQLDRTISSASEWVKLGEELARLQSRLEAYKAGRCHKNGQPVKVITAKMSKPKAARLATEVEILAMYPKAVEVSRERWGRTSRDYRSYREVEGLRYPSLLMMLEGRTCSAPVVIR